MGTIITPRFSEFGVEVMLNDPRGSCEILTLNVRQARILASRLNETAQEVENYLCRQKKTS
jgi:hypothetical protein